MAGLKPDFVAADLPAVNQDVLWARGVRAVLLDLDNTLAPWRSRDIPLSHREWVRQAQKRFSVCILSNTIKARRLRDVGAMLEVPTVGRWGIGRKPLQGGFAVALRLAGADAAQTAMIGDQLFTDILGGNRLGLVTVLVAPLSEREFFSTRLVRGLESRALASFGVKSRKPAEGMIEL